MRKKGGSRNDLFSPHPLWKVREHPQMNRKREWKEIELVRETQKE